MNLLAPPQYKGKNFKIGFSRMKTYLKLVDMFNEHQTKARDGLELYLIQQDLN